MELSLQVVSTFVAQHYWLLVFLVFLTLVVWYGTAPFSTFKKLRIPGPTPWPFVGNLPEIAEKGGNKEMFNVHAELVKEYGKVCGYYAGRRPVCVIADVDILKQVLVKDFVKFHNRSSAIRRNTPSPVNQGILLSVNENWKRKRSTISPTFSAFKLKQVVPLIHESCETLLQKVATIADSERSTDICGTYGKFTMEVILSAAFGVQAKTQADPNDNYTSHAKCLTKFQRLVMLSDIFPFLGRAVSRFRIVWNTKVARAFTFFVRTAYQMIDLRRKAGSSSRKDLLELMLHAELVDADGKKTSKLTDEEIAGQSMGFMFAGYETSSTTLAYTTYCLALNPDKQEKLLEEIDLAISEGEMPGYDTVQNLEYLDMVISEALRLYPPAFRFGRECNEACTINGIHFPKNMQVLVPAFVIHRDPEHWPDPETFEPERFSPEQKKQRNPFCYLPFGGGPRNCIGMRFALLEIKMALACILKKFKFERCADTQVPLKLTAATTMAPAHGVHIKVVRRK